jgi:CRP-like cAMP-binding protein
MPTTKTTRPHGHFDVLDGLSSHCRNAVIARCRRRAVAKGKTVWRQGEPANYVVIVVSGKVISWHEAPNGKAGTIGFWGPGDIAGLGDMGLTNVRQHTLKSLEPCSLMTLSFRDFEDLARQFPEFSLRVIRAFSVRLRWVAQLAVTLTTTSAVERMCAVLLTLTERFGVQHERGMLIDLKLTNEQLAAICGISRQFANSTLQSLREQGLLVGAPALVLTDLAALERIAYSR